LSAALNHKTHLFAIPRDQVCVLDHHHRRLQQAGQIHVLRQQPDLPAVMTSVV
jgi:hypothetical protein